MHNELLFLVLHKLNFELLTVSGVFHFPKLLNNFIVLTGLFLAEGLLLNLLQNGLERVLQRKREILGLVDNVEGVLCEGVLGLGVLGGFLVLF